MVVLVLKIFSLTELVEMLVEYGFVEVVHIQAEGLWVLLVSKSLKEFLSKKLFDN